ncbi:hypothetical protein [Microbacterium gorillae]|uniref:hypothetical protein n=1 Tax=Microbacterium gorillae TaxID=1231063 RepID=UPI00058C9D2B|nr:hypothetical protein [Microbacterium gorillae]
MSQLSQLKSRIENIAHESKRTATSLESFQRTFQGHAQEVQATIAGSAQRKDQEVVETLQEASRRVRDACAALERAAKVCSEYGRSL